MTDDTSAALNSALDQLQAFVDWDEYDVLGIDLDEARAILAHIADLEARAEKTEVGRLNVEERWLTAEAERREAVQRAEWAEAFGHVFHTLPDGRLDFVAVREGSELGKLHQRADDLAEQVAGLREAVTWLLNCHRGLNRHGHGVGGDGYWGNIDAATAFAREALDAGLPSADDVRGILVPPDAPSEPVYKAVERILDEESAWVARPSPEVTRRIALAVTIAAFQAHGVEAANAVRVDELEGLLREARAYVEYIADAESGSAEGAASRDLLADIDAALVEAEGRA